VGALAAFHGQGDELQLTFNFPFVFAPFTAEALSGVVAESLDKLPAGECAVWTASNHDISRFPTRWCGGDARQVRLALLVLATLPGALVLYYGDELGMTDVDVPPGLLRDRMRAEAGTEESRDRSRTPMRWDSSPSGGFAGERVQPWLPYGDPASGSVAEMQAEPSSILNLCRDLLALRRREFGGQLASYEQLPAPRGVWVYETGGLTVAANLSDEPATLDGPPGAVLLATAPGALDGLVLQPWAGVIARSVV
jgi:alpha-glucosidase